MAEYVVAVFYKYNCYNKIRIVNTVTREVTDISAADLYIQMTNPPKRKIENIYINGTTFGWSQGDSSWICHLDESMQTPRVNGDALVITKIDGEFVEVANYKGQIIRAHMLQVVNNVRRKKFHLQNGEIDANCRISISYRKEEDNRWKKDVTY